MSNKNLLSTNNNKPKNNTTIKKNINNRNKNQNTNKKLLTNFDLFVIISFLIPDDIFFLFSKYSNIYFELFK